MENEIKRIELRTLRIHHQNAEYTNLQIAYTRIVDPATNTVFRSKREALTSPKKSVHIFYHNLRTVWVVHIHLFLNLVTEAVKNIQQYVTGYQMSLHLLEKLSRIGESGVTECLASQKLSPATHSFFNQFLLHCYNEKRS